MATPLRLRPDCPIADADLGFWRQRLLAERRALLAGASPAPIQDDEVLLALVAEIDEVQVTVALIDAALVRVAGEGPLPFGICEETAAPIERERLALRPWTTLSADGERRRATSQTLAS